MTRSTRKIVVAAIALAVLVLCVSGAWYLGSAGFQERVRALVTEGFERATGGRVEMKSFQWNLLRLQFEIRGLTIHGREGAGEAPYVQADRVFVRARILSLFSRRVGLRYVGVERPVVHLVVYADGSTNQPAPKAGQSAGLSRPQQLLDLSIGRLEVTDGRLLLQDKPVPLDLDATDVTASLSYHRFVRRYEGELRAGKIQTGYPGLSSLASSAELRFVLWPNRVEVKSLKWASPRSQVEAHGSLIDFQAPRADFVYQASLDVSELGAVMRSRGLRAGKVESGGQVAYQARKLTSAGKLIWKNVEWQDDSVRASGINGGAQFTADTDRIALTSLFGAVFGGAVAGNAEIRNWAGGGPATAGRTKPEPPAGVANLKFNGIQLSQLMAALSAGFQPLAKLQPVGAAGGTLRAQWTGSLSSQETALGLEVVPPANPTPSQLPITARLQAVYHGSRQTIDVSQFDLVTRSTRVNATGVLGSATLPLRVSLNSTDFSEFSPVLALIGEGAFPADIHGHASFNGTISGQLSALAIAGRIEATDFDSLLSVPPAMVVPVSLVRPPKPVVMHWDLLRADVQYSSTQSSARHGLLRRGAAQIDFDVSANLRGGKFDADTWFSLRSRVENADLADLQALLARSYPVAGRLSLEVDLAGTINDLRGNGRMQITSLKIGPEPFTGLRANLRFAGRETQFNDIVLAHDGARVTGTFAYDLGTRGFRFDLRGADFKLAQFQQFQPDKFRIAGTGDFHATGSGTVEAPVIGGSLHILGLFVNGEEVGDLSADAVTHGADLQVHARTHRRSDELTVQGSAHMRDQWPADLAVQFRGFDIYPLLKVYLPGRITSDSRLDGAVSVKGPLREPRNLKIAETRIKFSTEVAKVPVEGQIRFDMADRVINLEEVDLTAEDNVLTAKGSVQLDGARELNVTADGQISMKLLQTFDPDLTTSGHIKVEHVKLGGYISRPELSGRLEVENAAISFIDLPNGLSGINGRLEFEKNRLAVHSLTAETGGGTFNVTGYISYANGLRFELDARNSSEIRLRYPPGVSAVGNAKLHYGGSLRHSRLTGYVEITRLAINARFDFAQYLTQARQVSTVPEPDSPLNNLHFDVHITSAPQVQVQTTSAKLSGNVDLRLRGTATHPILLGRVNVLEGYASISGARYHIERGDVTFSNPTRIEAVVNVEATARIRDYDISLGIHGVPPDKLNLTYRSDPPLPTADIIALLALGRTREESVLAATPTQKYTESASSAILSEALSSSVSSRSQKMFGLSRIKIDPQAGGPESNPAARVSIEQQVSDKVTLIFITNLSQAGQEIVQVEYNVNRNLTIIAIRDQNAVVSFDIRYRQRKR